MKKLISLLLFCSIALNATQKDALPEWFISDVQAHLGGDWPQWACDVDALLAVDTTTRVRILDVLADRAEREIRLQQQRDLHALAREPKNKSKFPKNAPQKPLALKTDPKNLSRQTAIERKKIKYYNKQHPKKR